MGKGSWRRARQVGYDEFEENWEKIFKGRGRGRSEDMPRTKKRHRQADDSGYEGTEAEAYIGQ